MSAVTVTPDDAGYDQARAVFNRSVDRRPARLVRCHSSDDVAVAIRDARGDGLALTVRAGGHNFGGHAAIEGGVVVDLRGLRRIEVDATTRQIHTGTGLLWHYYDAAAAPHVKRRVDPDDVFSSTQRVTSVECPRRGIADLISIR